MNKIKVKAANNRSRRQIHPVKSLGNVKCIAPGKNQTGVILLLTLFILSGILVITLAAADIVMSGIKMNRLTGYSGLAFFAAEAGLERSLWEARKNNYALPDNNQDDILCPSNPALCVLDNGSSYQLDYATSSPNVSFKSIGSYRGAKKSIASTYQTQ